MITYRFRRIPQKHSHATSLNIQRWMFVINNEVWDEGVTLISSDVYEDNPERNCESDIVLESSDLQHMMCTSMVPPPDWVLLDRYF